LKRGSLFDVAAKIEAGFSGQENVGEDHVRIDVGQAQHRGVAVGEADNFKTLLAQDPLTHALGVRAVVSQEDAAQHL
jgi:hypothetical protein